MQKSRIPAANTTLACSLLACCQVKKLLFFIPFKRTWLTVRYLGFVNAHPNLFGFIAGIQKDEFGYTMRARNIRSGSTLL
ncbi:hypothetical protein MXB_3352 [Myxobolus squamalis]|nr:hypothetical protein MXB_3352 [Myxobolus squamalis]